MTDEQQTLRAALENKEWDLFITLIYGDAAHVRLTGDDARKAILEAMEQHRRDGLEEVEKFVVVGSFELFGLGRVRNFYGQ